MFVRYYWPKFTEEPTSFQPHGFRRNEHLLILFLKKNQRCVVRNQPRCTEEPPSFRPHGLRRDDNLRCFCEGLIDSSVGRSFVCFFCWKKEKMFRQKSIEMRREVLTFSASSALPRLPQKLIFEGWFSRAFFFPVFFFCRTRTRTRIDNQKYDQKITEKNALLSDGLIGSTEKCPPPPPAVNLWIWRVGSKLNVR